MPEPKDKRLFDPGQTGALVGIFLKALNWSRVLYLSCVSSPRVPFSCMGSMPYSNHTSIENHRAVQQMGPPKITFNRRKFIMGEQMVANCSTYKSRPAPHITWLINGIKVGLPSFPPPLHTPTPTPEIKRKYQYAKPMANWNAKLYRCLSIIKWCASTRIFKQKGICIYVYIYLAYGWRREP